MKNYVYVTSTELKIHICIILYLCCCFWILTVMVVVNYSIYQPSLCCLCQDCKIYVVKQQEHVYYIECITECLLNV